MRSLPVEIITVHGERAGPSRVDRLAVEDPLEIRLGFQAPEHWTTRSISITMRTPDHDAELAAGFLLGEGIVHAPADIRAIESSARPGSNVVRVDLEPEVRFNPARLDRHFYTTSSCGVCGKSSLEALAQQGFTAIPAASRFDAALIHRLPGILRSSQNTFAETGGLHAAGLFTPAGELLVAREDVGRHNAVDKVTGHCLLNGLLPLPETLLMVSGRASFELVQKTIAAGFGILAAVGAPSSLAVELAQEYDLTLIGFVRDRRFNIYCGIERIRYESQTPG